MDYIEVKITQEHYKNIQKLKNRSMGVFQEMDEIERKYNTEYAGKKDIGFFAMTDDGYPAAYYGAFPMRFSYNGSEYIGAQSGDTMTDPDHQKKGLFTRLALKTYEYCESENISFVFGFPNANSFPGFKKKLNWEFYDTMYEFSYKGSKFPLCELTRKYPALKKIYSNFVSNRLKRYIIEVDSKIVDLFAQKASDFSVKKNIDFFRYKQGDDKYMVNIDGFVIFLKAETHLFIGDVAPFSEDKLDDFIKVLKKLSSLVLSRKVVLYLSKNHWLYNILSKKSTPIESLPIGFLKFKDELPFDKIAFSMADWDTF